MQITITLREVLARCSNWEDFCKEFGFSFYAVNEGGGDVEVTLTFDQALKHGLLRDQPPKYYTGEFSIPGTDENWDEDGPLGKDERFVRVSKS